MITTIPDTIQTNDQDYDTQQTKNTHYKYKTVHSINTGHLINRFTFLLR